MLRVELLKRTILDMVDSTCRGAINFAYVNKKLPKSDIIVIIQDTVHAYGFILAFIDNNEFYIDLICCMPGHGRPLLEFFIKEAIENRGIHSIGLSAIPNVLAVWLQSSS